jgi:ABC-type transport system substrate-binding protein
LYALVIRTGADINTTGYSNQQADDLIEQAKTMTDDTERQLLNQQLRQIVFEQAPIILVHLTRSDFWCRRRHRFVRECGAGLRE